MFFVLSRTTPPTEDSQEITDVLTLPAMFGEYPE